MKRSGYLVLTLVMTVVGTVAAGVGGHSAVAVAFGAGTAWVVQAVSFWLLAGRLQKGETALRVWAAGIATRVGVGVLVWVVGALAGVPTRELMIAYGLALAVFLIAEAAWLATVSNTTADRT